MLSAYFQAALALATFEELEDGTWVGEIPGFDGLLASATDLATCKEDLATALEDWTLLGLQLGHPIPVVGGIDLNLRKAA